MYRHLHPAGGRAEVLPEVLQVSGRSRSGDHEQRRSAAKRRAGGGPRSECHSKSSLRGHGTAPGIVFSSMPSVDLAGEIRSKRERERCGTRSLCPSHVQRCGWSPSKGSL